MGCGLSGHVLAERCILALLSVADYGLVSFGGCDCVVLLTERAVIVMKEVLVRMCMYVLRSTFQCTCVCTFVCTACIASIGAHVVSVHKHIHVWSPYSLRFVALADLLVVVHEVN